MAESLAIGTSTVVDAERIRHRREWLGYMAISLGAFMAILDIQIVASSINQIQAGLSAGADEIQWLQTSYLIAEVIAVPLSGYLARLFSTRVYFTFSALGFTAASLLCACAWNLESMVFFRIIQGFMGGGMMPTMFAAMFLLFREDKRRALPQLIGGLLAMIAPSTGPSLGGYITSVASWHWLFLINLIPGLICAWGVWTLVDFDKPRPELLKLTDWPGLVFMALFLGGLTYTLDEGPRADWFADSSVAICGALALVGGVLFFWRAFASDHPIVDLRAFRNRNFALSSMINVMIGIGIFTLNFLTPLFLGRVRGYDSLQIGQVMMIQGCSMFVMAPLVSVLWRRFDPRLVIAIGILMAALGSWMNSHMTADWGLHEFMWPQILRGVGTMFVLATMTNVALGTLRAEEVNNASGLYTVMRNIGGAIGLALVATLLNNRLWLHWQSLNETLRLSRPAVQDFVTHVGQALAPGAAGDSTQGVAMLARLAERQALTMAYNDMYLLVALTVVATLFLVPLLEKPKAQMADVGH